MKTCGVMLGAAAGLLALLASGPSSAVSERPPRALPLQESLEKARVDGKYAMLVRQIKVEQDFAEYGVFRNAGRRPAAADYHGNKDVPAGFWVYVYPYWYIWRDEADKPAPAKRAGGRSRRSARRTRKVPATCRRPGPR